MDEISNIGEFILPNNIQVVLLDCKRAFEQLSKTEKLYAHYLSQAAWYGGLIVLLQTSKESPMIFCLLQKIFRGESIAELRAKNPHISDYEFKALLVYTCGLFSNMGNYRSFGDSKFIPNLNEEKFQSIVFSSEAYRKDPRRMRWLWSRCKEKLYSIKPNERALGFPEKGVTTYLSTNITQDDLDRVNDYYKDNRVEGYNSRTFKIIKNDKITYVTRLASVKYGFDGGVMLEPSVHNGRDFRMSRGDYSELLEAVCHYLEKAMEHTENAYEKLMLRKYISSFTTGSLEDHKEGSRYWIKDKSPIVETYIGFIETYRDPCGIRGEFEGFVAVVNKNMSEKFKSLVSEAKHLISKLPWGPEFEKDEFLEPDFTSLDVLTFAGSGIPAGINIPNYDEIRQEEGFKNVSLGNVIPAAYKNNDFFFLSLLDQVLMTKYSIPAFEVQVGLHELLGHGSGKLFRRLSDGTFNFKNGEVFDPLTNQLVNSWYEEGETYDSSFTDISSAYEECRAECVGLYLSLDPEILRIFGHVEKQAEDIVYVNWLNLLWSGTGKALEMYDPETKTWLQAHSQARFVITQVILEAGEGLFTVEETTADEDLLCKLDRSKIATVGKAAIAQFLIKLQTYKSTKNVQAAREMFMKYSKVDDSGPGCWARWRSIIIKHKRPRKMFVQCNTSVIDGDVVLKEYATSYEGLIESWIDRFKNEDVLRWLMRLHIIDDVCFL